MARFSDIEQGTRAVKIIDLPLANVPHGIQKGTPEQEKERELRPAAYRTLKVGVRALLPFERECVLELAAQRIKGKGAAEPANPLYNHAVAVYTVAMACVDPDAPPGKEAALFFGDTVEQAADMLRKSPHMTDDIILYLREMQECWQDAINPQALTIPDNDLWEVTQKAAESEDFLAGMRRGLLVSLLHITAAQLLFLLEDKSLPTSTESPASIGK